MSDRTQDLKNLRAVATACKNYVDETKEQILWQVGQYDITTQDDNTTAYQKVVPTGATRAKIKSIGGMSYKCSNLIDTTDYTFGGDAYNATITITKELQVGTTYTLSYDTSISSNIVLTNATLVSPSGYVSRTYIVFTPTDNNVVITLTGGSTSNNLRDKLNNMAWYMLNVGSTALPYQPYFTDIRDSVITSVKSYDSNNNLIDTYTIDSHIQALTGYGKGISNDLYNYIDLDTKKYSYDCDLLNNITISSISSISNETNKFYAFAKPSNIDDTKGLYSSNYICDKYPVRQQSSLTDTSLQYSIVVNINRNVAYLCLPTSLDYTIEQAQALINGTNIIYPTTLQETDISEYITNNVIEVEEGGYLVFENPYGQAVPSNVTYRIEVAS